MSNNQLSAVQELFSAVCRYSMRESFFQVEFSTRVTVTIGVATKVCSERNARVGRRA